MIAYVILFHEQNRERECLKIPSILQIVPFIFRKGKKIFEEGTVPKLSPAIVWEVKAKRKEKKEKL